MRSFKEYKERKEAQRYFRSNNDQFLSPQQWIKTLCSGLFGAVIVGIIHGVLTTMLGIDFSLFYVVIGIAIANILNASSNIATHQIGLASVGCTFVAYVVSNLTLTLFLLPFPYSIMSAVTLIFSGDIFNLIFILLGLIVAYYQGAQNRFM